MKILRIEEGRKRIFKDEFAYTDYEMIYIPDTIEFIDDFAFCGCENLTKLVIPNGVTSIGNCVFYDCKNLTDVILPDTIEKLGDNVFEKCSKLVEIHYMGTKELLYKIKAGDLSYGEAYVTCKPELEDILQEGFSFIEANRIIKEFEEQVKAISQYL